VLLDGGLVAQRRVGAVGEGGHDREQERAAKVPHATATASVSLLAAYSLPDGAGVAGEAAVLRTAKRSRDSGFTWNGS